VPTYQTASSAYAIANAINNVASQSGVTATATTDVVGSTATLASGAIPSAANTTINGVVVGNVAAGGNAAGQGANVAAAINLVSSQTGVTATADAAGKVTLNAADGRDIVVGLGFTAANSGIVGSATAFQGTVTLSSTSSAGIAVAGTTPGNAGLSVTTQPATKTTISSMDVLTAAHATSALDTIDGALATVNASRAALGALQNRFTSVVTSLQTTGENLSASKSRITDADFAAETANLSRAQILQQAGTAMVAQANQLPQGVLALLK